MLTLILCAYNEQLDLPVALESLEQQVDKDFTLVLVDNSSTDQTKLIMEQFQKLSSIKTIIISEPKLGKINALKTGIKTALKLKSTTVLAFSDADALFGNTWSSEVKELFIKHPCVAFGYSTERQQMQKLIKYPQFAKCMDIYTNILFKARSKVGGYMNMGNCYVRKDAYLKVGGIEKHWQKSEDTLLTIKLLLAGFEGAYCTAPIWFSPRRFLDKDNIIKWCKDEEIRELVTINNLLTIKPIRDNNLSYSPTKDITPEIIRETLKIRSRRIFRRFLVLTIYDNNPKRKILSNLKHLVKDSECENLIKKWARNLPKLKKQLFSNDEDTLTQYQIIDMYLRSNYGDLINLGGDLVRQEYVDKVNKPSSNLFRRDYVYEV